MENGSTALYSNWDSTRSERLLGGYLEYVLEWPASERLVLESVYPREYRPERSGFRTCSYVSDSVCP
jgi:hypothetical protein